MSFRCRETVIQLEFPNVSPFMLLWDVGEAYRYSLSYSLQGKKKRRRRNTWKCGEQRNVLVNKKLRAPISTVWSSGRGLLV